VRAGDDLATLVAAAASDLRDGDVLVIAQKVVSKAEGRLRALAGVVPSAEAVALADDFDKDPRLVQLVFDESAAVVRVGHGVLICETRHGFVCANAGVDLSNSGNEGVAVLLPVDPDASARRIRAGLSAKAGLTPDRGVNSDLVRIGVVISDSFGRPWRLGVADVAIGAAGVDVLEDWRGRSDADGCKLRVTEVAIADQLAAAADLVRAKDSGEPVVLVRGAERFVTSDDGPGAAALRRPRSLDLFR